MNKYGASVCLCFCAAEEGLHNTAIMLCNTCTPMHAGAHCATDVTGFGILGHARNLAKAQKGAVSFKLHSLPSKILCSVCVHSG